MTQGAGGGRVHGTCVAIDGVGVLIRGEPGAGKSDLALRLIDAGARLVADDQVLLAPARGQLRATAPATLQGRMEVRGLGIVEAADAGPMTLGLVVDLVSADDIPRLPEPAALSVEIFGVAVPRVFLDPASPSAAARVRAALRHLRAGKGRPSPLVLHREK